MKTTGRRGKKVFWFGLGIFALVFAATFLGVQFFTKTGIFRIPGVVYYDESLGDGELEILSGIFTEEVDLDKDVTISARNELTLPELGEGEFLYNIYVPVTDFYSTDENITVESVDELFTNCVDCSYKLINVEELDFSRKLLKINSKYYLDEFDAGAVFRIISFESELYEKEIAPLIGDKFDKKFPGSDTVLTMAQTGVTAFSRLMNAKMNEVGDGGYFAENLASYLSSFDFTHTSNEASFSDWAPTGGATGTPICADKRFIDTLLAIGLDIVELTGNHNRDCGDIPALESIDMYEANGIKIVGGGRTADEAATPLILNKKGSGVTMLAYNLSTGGATYDDTPGANQYYDENVIAEIANAKARGDLVIVDMQYYECNYYVSDTEETYCDYAGSMAGDQIGFFRYLIDLGADIVVGTSAHQPQTFELYGNGVIYYGLGNLFFDQYRWPGTTRSLILSHYFYNGKLLQTRIMPTVYDGDFQTRLIDEETRKWYLGRLASERP